MGIRVGTSGWNYPGGKGSWNGIFYPAKRARGFDELSYYAEHFDTVEVNSTFYRVPEADLARKWMARTPRTFQFSVKLYQKFTHPDMYLARAKRDDWDVSRTDLDLFKAGIGPLADAGRLGALLVQFPASFHAEPDTRAYVDWLLEMFAGYPVAVEFRHASWSDDGEATSQLLAGRGAVWVFIDEPQFADSLVHPIATASESGDKLVYVRMHGRNTAAWWAHEASEDRYNYLYSPGEISALAAGLRAADRPGRRVLVHFNNHFSAKAAANAAVLKHQLGELVPGDYPPEMIARYPDLKDVVRVAGLPI